MFNKLIALMHHGTWDLVSPPVSYNLMGCKWVFRVKRKPNVFVKIFMVKLVENGYNQRPKIDYKETFCLEVKPTTIRIILTITIMNG